MNIKSQVKRKVLEILIKKNIKKNGHIMLKDRLNKLHNIKESNILIDIFLNSLDAFEPELTSFLLNQNNE